MENLEITQRDVIKQDSPLDLTCLHFIADLPFPDLKYKPFRGKTPSELQDIDAQSTDSFFSAINQGEILLHHPYQSFSESVVKFLENAARDPKVLTIKQTLYRTSGDSPIVTALIEAAKAGKQVLVVVEVKARFDEMANLRWAKLMEESGIHVVYGVLGLKTHAKLSLVVRDEPSGLKRYSHVGTGNYNPKTARMYEDLGILSSDETLGEDLTRLFNELSGLSRESEYSRMLVAPRGLRAGITSRIDREIDNHLAGKTAWIRIKLNSLLDEKIIAELYRAADAGVKIDLVIRGICTLELQTQKRRDNIKVRSILGRFLEHSRIYYFHNDGNPEYWIGSADLMQRNLDRRVEALVRIDQSEHKIKLKEILDSATSDRFFAWKLGEKNKWSKNLQSEDKEPLQDLHAYYLEKREVKND
jgi:polyphosphate kinase